MTPAANVEAPPPGKVLTLLAEVQALPSADQEAFAELFQNWKSTKEKQSLTENRQEDIPVQWPDFAGRMKAVFGERVIPGDPQEFWDEERGR